MVDFFFQRDGPEKTSRVPSTSGFSRDVALHCYRAASILIFPIVPRKEHSPARRDARSSASIVTRNTDGPSARGVMVTVADASMKLKAMAAMASQHRSSIAWSSSVTYSYEMEMVTSPTSEN